MNTSMRKRKKMYLAQRQYWRRYWRYRVFGEIFFPTTIILPKDLGLKIDLSDIGTKLED